MMCPIRSAARNVARTSGRSPNDTSFGRTACESDHLRCKGASPTHRISLAQNTSDATAREAQDFPHERKWSPILILIDDSLRAVAEWSETARNDEIVLVNSFDVRGERIYKSSIVLCSDRSSSNELRT